MQESSKNEDIYLYNICWKNMSLVMLNFLHIKKYRYFNSNIKTHENPILILGSPFTCVAVGGVSVSGLKSTLPANKLTTFTIETPSLGSSEFSAVVDITSKTACHIHQYMKWIIFKQTIFKIVLLSLQYVIST